MPSSHQKRNPQLYVARLASHVTKDDIKHKFRRFGRINNIVVKNRYCFIEYDDYKDANYALDEMDGAIFEGNRIVVQKAGDNKERRRSSGRGPSANDRCFNCGRKGHWANECRYYRKRSRYNSSYSRSRSSSYSRSRSSKSYDRNERRSYHKHRHSESSSRSRSKSRSKSPKSRSHSKHSKSKSILREKSKSKSKSQRKSLEKKSEQKEKEEHNESNKQNEVQEQEGQQIDNN